MRVYLSPFINIKLKRTSNCRRVEFGEMSKRLSHWLQYVYCLNSSVQICTINYKLFMFGIVSSDRTKYILMGDKMPKYTNIEVFGSWKWKEKLILYLLPRDQPNQSAVVSILRKKCCLFDFS